MQSKKASLTESVVGTAVGLIISGAVTSIVLTASGAPNPMQTTGILLTVLTLASILRGYWIRRLFENRDVKKDISESDQNASGNAYCDLRDI